MMIGRVKQKRFSIVRRKGAEQRVDSRFRKLALASIEAKGRRGDAILCDISVGGYCAETDVELAPGRRCELRIPLLREPLKGTVVSSHAGTVRVKFERMPPKSALALAKEIVCK